MVNCPKCGEEMVTVLVDFPDRYIRDNCACGYVRARIYLKNKKAKDAFSKAKHGGEGRSELRFMDFIRKYYGKG